MARVFDALRREQQRKKREGAHDPLAQRLRSTATNEAEPEPPEFDPAAPIGTPVGPRSNEGMLLPGAARTISATSPEPAPTIQTVAPAPTSTTAPVSTPTTVALPSPAPVVTNAAAETAPLPGKTFQAPVTRAPQGVTAATVRSTDVHPRLLMWHEPYGIGCEEYRTLRTQLFHTAERELTQVILLTSAVSGEGKTATTLNLALAIAQSNRRVLVIDGDLRRPNIAQYLALKPLAGFTEVLNDKNDLFDTITRLADHELYVLPVKRESTTPTELLSSPRLAETLTELRQSFDFILIDAPPVKPFADTRLLANHADAVLMVIRAGFAAYETVAEAVQALADQRILGVVLNNAEDVQEFSTYEDYQTHNGATGGENPVWSALLPKVRGSWLGRRLKL